MNRCPAQPIRHHHSRLQHQRTPSSRHDPGAALEMLKPRSSNLRRPQFPRSRPSTRPCWLRHVFKPSLFPAIRACSRSASRADTGTKPTSNSWPRSRVWSAGGAPPMPTICASPNPGQWGSRSATSLPYPCAGPITGTTTTSETKSPGGRGGLSIPSRRRGSYGFRHEASDESQRCSRFERWEYA
jgi:hypothetical protein